SRLFRRDDVVFPPDFFGAQSAACHVLENTGPADRAVGHLWDVLGAIAQERQRKLGGGILHKSSSETLKDESLSLKGGAVIPRTFKTSRNFLCGWPLVSPLAATGRPGCNKFCLQSSR